MDGGGGGRGRSGDGDRGAMDVETETIPAFTGIPTTGLDGMGGTPLTTLPVNEEEDVGAGAGAGAGGRIGARGRGGGGLDSWLRSCSTWKIRQNFKVPVKATFYINDVRIQKTAKLS